MSPIIECPPTDVFSSKFNKYNEPGRVKKMLRYNRLHLGFYQHCQCDFPYPTKLNYTPAPPAERTLPPFADLNVCWECDSDSLEQSSPTKRRHIRRRCSSLDSASPVVAGPNRLVTHRHASERAVPLSVPDRKLVFRVREPLKQENVPYPYSLLTRSLLTRPLGQLDGTSDGREENQEGMDNDLPYLSPSIDHTADTPSDGTPATPSTVQIPGHHTRRGLPDSVDLTLPFSSAVPEPFNLFSDDPTPLTRATPARGAFPFPEIERSRSSLTPLKPRTQASPIRSSQRHLTPETRSRSLTPSRKGDRFIPVRKVSQSPSESLHVTKPPNKLVSSERVLRSNQGSSDPFGRDVPRTPPRSAGRPRQPGASSVPLFGPIGPNNVLGVRRSPLTPGARQISQGAVWNVGGSAAAQGDSVPGVHNGQNGLLARGTNAPLYSANFLARSNSTGQLEVHERRIALALDFDTSSRVLSYHEGNNDSSPTLSASVSPQSPEQSDANTIGNRVWRNSEWIREGSVTLLDAPSLRDDFYCSLLAYSHTAKCLAVGLGSHVYLWAESQGTDTPDSLRTQHPAHVSSLAFSSVQGGKAILGIGRADGRILLWSPLEQDSRFDSVQPSPICCVAFRPTTVKRPSLRDPYIMADTEELLIGDEVGHVYFYSVEWPNKDQRELFGWPGALTLIARVTAHGQQICGLAWSSDGEWFASGGNDNTCHLYETEKVLEAAAQSDSADRTDADRLSTRQTVDLSTSAFTIPNTIAKHKWSLQAAVKAIAFCPWQRGLLAVGGGSNDRCIHFYHTISGACLGTIDCSAQVTSLIWSTTRREIAATFGFAQPDHPYRIAVFAWPSCEQIVAIPWFDEHRALYAISYPGGPNVGRTKGEGGMWWNRTQEEGCLVVATSDCSIKFHEVWAEEKKTMGTKGGLLGGSDILEALHGIDKVGEVIR